jgi:hypothetical protein
MFAMALRRAQAEVPLSGRSGILPVLARSPLGNSEIDCPQ